MQRCAMAHIFDRPESIDSTSPTPAAATTHHTRKQLATERSAERLENKAFSMSVGAVSKRDEAPRGVLL
jgi:hypothetical protein